MSTDQSKSVERWVVVGFRVAEYQACPGAPVQPAGCCQKCGQGIKYVVTVQNQDGVKMDVGTDCAITLEGGPELRAIRRAEREYQHQLYLASPEYKERCEREAREAAEKSVRMARANEEHALELAGLDAIINHPTTNPRARDTAIYRAQYIRNGYAYYETNDEDRKQMISALNKALTENSSYMGVPGSKEKLSCVAMVEDFIPLPDGVYGPSYIHKFRTTDGSLLVWFSKAGMLNKDDIGSMVRLVGKVKKHEEYRGEHQTVLTHVKTEKL